MRTRGFTLIELMIVIGIIGMLATIVLGAFNYARESARNKTAMAQLRAIKSGLVLLEYDTGKLPNGCLPGVINATEEIDLNTSNAGLASLTDITPANDPVITDNNPNPDCMWTLEDEANWKGPYIPIGDDPWGRSYLFDPDYYTDGTFRKDCGAHSGITNKEVVVMSKGPNGLGGTDAEGYDCDDIVYFIEEGRFIPNDP